MHQEAQLTPPKIEQTAEEAHPDKGKATDTDPKAKKTASKGKKTMATKTKTFRRRQFVRLALASTQSSSKSIDPNLFH
ncbi:Uncharacterized protein TCM_024064 [Theobroma cacao]|uniref:Uncharacterized protein n=1 Tax=Theobroma cacao TaxID=3641 RepID=A0A061F2S6_THECC|nr:Uncharacterized protein TCM_024064 [Theobroma cacao]